MYGWEDEDNRTEYTSGRTLLRSSRRNSGPTLPSFCSPDNWERRRSLQQQRNSSPNNSPLIPRSASTRKLKPFSPQMLPSRPSSGGPYAETGSKRRKVSTWADDGHHRHPHPDRPSDRSQRPAESEKRRRDGLLLTLADTRRARRPDSFNHRQEYQRATSDDTSPCSRSTGFPTEPPSRWDNPNPRKVYYTRHREKRDGTPTGKRFAERRATSNARRNRSHAWEETPAGDVNGIKSEPVEDFRTDSSCDPLVKPEVKQEDDLDNNKSSVGPRVKIKENGTNTSPDFEDVANEALSRARLRDMIFPEMGGTSSISLKASDNCGQRGIGALMVAFEKICIDILVDRLQMTETDISARIPEFREVTKKTELKPWFVRGLVSDEECSKSTEDFSSEVMREYASKLTGMRESGSWGNRGLIDSPLLENGWSQEVAKATPGMNELYPASLLDYYLDEKKVQVNKSERLQSLNNRFEFITRSLLWCLRSVPTPSDEAVDSSAKRKKSRKGKGKASRVNSHPRLPALLTAAEGNKESPSSADEENESAGIDHDPNVLLSTGGCLTAEQSVELNADVMNVWFTLLQEWEQILFRLKTENRAQKPRQDSVLSEMFDGYGMADEDSGDVHLRRTLFLSTDFMTTFEHALAPKWNPHEKFSASPTNGFEFACEKVFKYFSRRGLNPWEWDLVCWPVNYMSAHWVLLTVDINAKELIWSDSYQQCYVDALDPPRPQRASRGLSPASPTPTPTARPGRKFPYDLKSSRKALPREGALGNCAAVAEEDQELLALFGEDEREDYGGSGEEDGLLPSPTVDIGEPEVKGAGLPEKMTTTSASEEIKRAARSFCGWLYFECAEKYLKYDFRRRHEEIQGNAPFTDADLRMLQEPWKRVVVKDLPQQSKFSLDCGVYAANFARNIAQFESPFVVDFEVADVARLRSVMAVVIGRGNLPKSPREFIRETRSIFADNSSDNNSLQSSVLE